MQSQQTDDVPALESRRARREAEHGPRRPRRSQAQVPGQHRWVPRVAVLSTLAMATIAMPLSAGADDGLGARSPFEPDARPAGPSALDLATAASTVPALSENVAAAPRTAARSDAASRSFEREPLPGCDPTVRPTGTNGNLDQHELCELWQAGDFLRPDAAVALSALNEAFRASFGRDLCLVSSYRTLSTQVSLKSTRGGFAARPGTSMHGWGLAIDLCSIETGSRDVYAWLNANGETYGWANPPWAKRGGGGAYEPWHFEFTEGVEEMGGA
ncbi:D-alanyl-D-alanine carboxypeptidase family protein [Cellulosimicrobium sp. Marseille-Q4280]|uniref:M15 family metallopeptidase n=1 Tax=Cellulosimicrobium sp. Marseille-Q4280 TaxID=2937992 RepID=UPI00203AC2D7|nr:D-alanyl-D-alanine carboxypeptidase family protein [Cellulosimicrobium sp. Marseille-Q4280]